MLAIHDAAAAPAASFSASGASLWAGSRCRRCSPLRGQPRTAARDRQIRHLPLPAGRAEPVRDVRPEAGRAGRNPHRRRRHANRAARRHLRRHDAEAREARRQVHRRPLLRDRQRGPQHPAHRRPRIAQREHRLAVLARRRRHAPDDRDADQRGALSAGRERRRGEGLGPRRHRRDRLGRQRVRAVRARRRRAASEELAAQPARPIASTIAANCSKGSTTSSAKPKSGSRTSTREQRQACEVLLSGPWPTRSICRANRRASSRSTTRATTSRPHNWEQRRPRQARLLHRPREVARQAAAAGPPAVRGRAAGSSPSTPTTRACGTCTPTATT